MQAGIYSAVHKTTNDRRKLWKFLAQYLNATRPGKPLPLVSNHLLVCRRLRSSTGAFQPKWQDRLRFQDRGLEVRPSLGFPLKRQLQH